MEKFDFYNIYRPQKFYWNWIERRTLKHKPSHKHSRRIHKYSDIQLLWNAIFLLSSGNYIIVVKWPWIKRCIPKLRERKWNWLKRYNIKKK